MKILFVNLKVNLKMIVFLKWGGIEVGKYSFKLSKDF